MKMYFGSRKGVKRNKHTVLTLCNHQILHSGSIRSPSLLSGETASRPPPSLGLLLPSYTYRGCRSLLDGGPNAPCNSFMPISFPSRHPNSHPVAIMETAQQVTPYHHASDESV